ncbi:MAG: hypothetical protein AAGC46_13300, partial [Solirubrobacteraceae bacterium]
ATTGTAVVASGAAIALGTGAPTAVPVVARTLATGVYTVTVVATDDAGNRSAPARATLTITAKRR